MGALLSSGGAMQTWGAAHRRQREQRGERCRGRDIPGVSEEKRRPLQLGQSGQQGAGLAGHSEECEKPVERRAEAWPEGHEPGG